jgi:cytochrome c
MPKSLSCVIAGVAVAVLSAVSADAGQTSDDELAFNNHCRECHTADKGDNRLGPTLYGVIGRKAGTEPGYANYSAAVKDSGVVWSAATLDAWITNPDAFLPGNNMHPFAGVDDSAQRARIIQYLSTRPET